MTRVLLVCAVLAAAAGLVLAGIRGPAAPATMDDRVHAIASTLRCPVCLNLSAADSPSPVAEEMRATVRRDLEAGKTPAQVRQEFVDAYGEWILLSPAPHGINLLAWVIPGLLAGAGLGAGVWAIRRWTSAGKRAPGDSLSANDRALLEQAMANAAEEGE